MEIKVMTKQNQFNVTVKLDLIIPAGRLDDFACKASDLYLYTFGKRDLFHGDELVVTVGFEGPELNLDLGVKRNAEKLARFMKLVKESGMPIELASKSVYHMAKHLICNTANYQKWVRQMDTAHYNTLLVDSHVTTCKDGLYGMRTVAIPAKSTDSWLAFHGMGNRMIYSDTGCNNYTYKDFIRHTWFTFYHTKFDDSRRGWINLPRAIIHPAIRDACGDLYDIGNYGLPDHFDDYVNSVLVMSALNCDGVISSDEDAYALSYDFWQCITCLLEEWVEDHVIVNEFIEATLKDYIDVVSHYPHKAY